MKSLVRWSATAGLIGSALVGSVLVGAIQVLALTQEQIIQKLRFVPVYAIANSKGEPLFLSSSSTGQKAATFSGIFINKKDAQNFLSTIKTKQPELPKDVQVVTLPMAEVYRLSQTTKTSPEKAEFVYVPSEQQITSALTLLKQSGKQVNQFNATPLFALVSKDGNKEGFVVLRRNDQPVIPLFFEKEQIQLLLEDLKKQQPNLVAKASIEVLSLEGLLKQMEVKDDKNSTRDDFLKMVQLVPTREGLELLRSQSSPQPGQSPQNVQNNAKPAPAPKK